MSRFLQVIQPPVVHTGSCVDVTRFSVLNADKNRHNDHRWNTVVKYIVADAAERIGCQELSKRLLATAVSAVALFPKVIPELSESRCLLEHGVSAFSIIGSDGELHEIAVFAPDTPEHDQYRLRLMATPPNLITGALVDKLASDYTDHLPSDLSRSVVTSLKQRMWASHSKEAQLLHAQAKSHWAMPPKFNTAFGKGIGPKEIVPGPIERAAKLRSLVPHLHEDAQAFPCKFNIHELREGGGICWVLIDPETVLVLAASKHSGISLFSQKRIVYMRRPENLSPEDETNFKHQAHKKPILSLPTALRNRINTYPLAVHVQDKKRPGVVWIVLQKKLF